MCARLFLSPGWTHEIKKIIIHLCDVVRSLIASSKMNETICAPPRLMLAAVSGTWAQSDESSPSSSALLAQQY